MSGEASLSLQQLPDLDGAAGTAGIDKLWLQQDPELSNEVAGLAARAGVVCPEVLVVPWLGHRCLDRAVGSYGLAEIHQPAGQRPILFITEAALTDLSAAGRRQILAHEIAHLKLHGPLPHEALRDRAVAVAAYLPLVSWVAASQLAHLDLRLQLVVGAALWMVARMVNPVRHLIGEIRADRYGAELEPVAADEVHQLWSYLEDQMGAGGTDWIRRRCHLAVAQHSLPELEGGRP